MFFTLSVVSGLLVTLVRGLPTAIQGRDVSSSLLSQLSFIEQYAAAAYCPGNNNASAGAAITCSAGNCPLVQSADAVSMVEFQNIGITDATGYVAVDHTNSLIVISFRGSDSIENWIANLDIVMEDWSICSGCLVHSGFMYSWSGARSAVESALSSASEQWPQYSVIATGHSLGAALATLAAAELRSQGYTVASYTYGSPMVGNAQLATFITNQTGGNFRVTHADDIVPKVPGYPVGYAHVSPEYWITSATNDPVTMADIEVSSGVLDIQGNDGTLLSSVTDHLWYFNAISGCAPAFSITKA